MSLELLLQILLYKVPELLVYAIPVGVLFSIFLAIGRMSYDREIIALQSSGYSLVRILVPTLIFSSVMGLVSFGVSDYLAPIGNKHHLDASFKAFFSGQPSFTIRDNAMLMLGEKRHAFIKHHDRENSIMEEVFIYDLSNAIQIENCGAQPIAIFAEKAKVNDGSLDLEQGYVHCYDVDGSLISTMAYEDLSLNVTAEFAQYLRTQKSTSEMRIGELFEYARQSEIAGLSKPDLLIQLHLRLAIPVSTLILSLLAGPLSLLVGPRGKSAGIILGLLLVLGYQGLLFWTAVILGARSDIDAGLGVWLPNIVFAVIGLALLISLNHMNKSRLYKT